MAITDKDTIYVDIDDEITSIIDKVRGSQGRIIALVLPKRAAVFQSIVNMKLLKRAGDVAKKRVVLVTTDPNLLPLAGTVGLYVAATPQSKPDIPMVAPVDASVSDDMLADGTEEAYTLDNAADRPVGELAQQSGHMVGVATPTIPAPDEVVLDDEVSAAAVTTRPARDRSLAVPNFNRFRLLLVLAIVVLIGLVAAFYVCVTILPRAVIAISTDASHLSVSLPLTLDPSAKTLDTTNGVVPAKSEQQQKTTSQQVAATGQQNNGNSATGSVTMSAQACAPHLGTPDSVPAGTGVSTNGLTFITDGTATFSFDHFSGGSCAVYKSGAVDMTSQSPGAKYNVSAGTSFSVAGRSDIASVTGSASGGTDNLVKVVAQADIDGATQKLATQDADSIKATLSQTLHGDGLYPLTTTFNTGTPTVTTSAKAGDTADTVTVTQVTTYTMLGAAKADLDMLISRNIQSRIDTKNQTILDDGLTSATFTVNDSSTPALKLSLQSTASVGPSIDPNVIKTQVKNKQAGDVKSLINAIPGVTNVDVRLSPFWVTTVPADSAKVHVSVDKAS